MRLLLSVCVAIVFLAPPAYADKTCYKISKIVYSHQGAYNVCFHIRWWDRDKQEVVALGNDDLQENCTTTGGENLEFNLNKPKSYADWKANHLPQQGEEVWGQFQIRQGESKSCRNNEGRVFYYYPDGGSVTYWSKGTPQIDNKCRVRQPEAQYKIDCPDPSANLRAVPTGN
ncbi:MAG: hypothetical protein GC201_06355 [Alphaproteobacteria bacterium]|nr:hypothetical protein [Alphaproteobacteria bacterium]